MKRKARFCPEYTRPYIAQLRMYVRVKDRIESPVIQKELSRLEEELLR